MKAKTFFADINTSGTLVMSRQDVFFHFLNSNPNEKVRLTLEIIPESTSEQLYFYYWYYVLSEVRNAFHNLGYAFTPKQVDYELRHNYTDAFYYISSLGEHDVLEFFKAGNQRALLFLEQVKQFAAENLNIVINEPNGHNKRLQRV